ncbi:MAG TPA: hypothetical protein VEO56_07835 [Bacteroidota bacterium]|nr:hypothetical protein [Bacteroidota bacterium]
MSDDTLEPKQPGQETLLRRLKRGLLEGYPSDQTGAKSAAPAPALKGWSDSLATISTGVVAIATLAGWLFGGAHGFPHWFTYIITVFVLVAIYKYSERHVGKLIQYLSLRSYLRQERYRLVEIIQGFGDLISLKLDDSVSSVIRRISERSGTTIVEPELFDYPNEILSNILLRLTDAGKKVTVSEFKGVLNDLSTLLTFCSHLYFKKPLESNKLGHVTAADRNSLELARENFADFVRRFQAFHDEIHLRLGTGTRARFDVPKPF